MGNQRLRRLAAVFTAGALTAVAGAACAPPPPPGADVPIIFVHGYLGSGSQYRTQAMRFASNGWPAERIRAFDYGTLNVDASQLGAYVDAVRAEFGVPKVHLVGHSLGTGVVNNFMGNATQAAKVDRFVLVDGAGCPLGSTTCLSISAGGMGQTHVEAATSAESFRRQYVHFTGAEPVTTDVVAEDPGQVDIAGKVLDLQVNTPVAGATGRVFAVNPTTGARTAATPESTFTVAADGSFGPIEVDGTRHYEIAVQRADLGGRTFHYYHQPFVRDSYILRLTSSPPGSATVTNTNTGPNHSVVVVTRYREWWRSHGAANDTLSLSVTRPGQPAAGPHDVFQNVTGDVVGIHVHDDKATPGQTTLGLLPYFSSQFFQTGVDVFIPASPAADGTVTLTNAPRGDTSKVQRLALPNWPSDGHASIVDFNDWVQ